MQAWNWKVEKKWGDLFKNMLTFIPGRLRTTNVIEMWVYKIRILKEEK